MTSWKSRITPLCIHSQRPWRNGWQFVCWTGEPDEARMCANTSGELMCADELAQVAVVPGGLDAVEDAGRVADAVPADRRSRRRSSSRRRAASGGSGRSASAAAGRAGPRCRIGRAGVCEPAAHARSPFVGHQWWKPDAVELSWTGCGCCWRRGSCRFRSSTSMSAMSWVKPLLHDDAQRGEVGPVRRERVGGHEPAALPQGGRDVEDGEVVDVVARA